MIKQDTPESVIEITATGPVIGRLMKFHVVPMMHAAVQEALHGYVLSALEARGNIMAEACYQEDDASVLWVVERWADTASLDANDTGKPMRKITSLRRRGTKAPSEDVYFMDMERLSRHAYRHIPKEEDDPYTLLTFIYADQATGEGLRSIYHASAPTSISPGVVVYQLSQDLIDDSKFITYEKFRSRKAFEERISPPAAGPVTDLLQPVSKPPFEKGFHTLIEFAPLLRAGGGQVNMGSAGMIK